jgi:hypothetical protein
MFRFAAPLLASAVALNDETSLMQGLKPQQVTQKEDKSKAISNLLQSATQMLKNGATPDVVEFTEATLAEITSLVLPAIVNASNTDQQLVDDTHLMFAQALEELSEGNNRVLAANNARGFTATNTRPAAHRRKQPVIPSGNAITISGTLGGVLWRRSPSSGSCRRRLSATSAQRMRTVPCGSSATTP